MISTVLVYLDDNEFEYMDGSVRCGHLVIEDENGQETLHQDLFDNAGYRSIRELVDDVVGVLQVRREAVLVAV